jgi:hypothetical protein
MGEVKLVGVLVSTELMEGYFGTVRGQLAKAPENTCLHEAPIMLSLP